jgi:hypothetical protein
VLANGQAATAFTEGVSSRLFELMYELPPSFDTEIEYFLEESEKAVAEMQAQIADVPSGITGLATGVYHNELLGDVTVRLLGDNLIIDAGEFSAALKYVPGATTDDEFTLIAADPPVTGTPFTLRIGEDGDRELEIDIGTDQYVFTSTGNSPPIALPQNASPIAA